MSCLIGAGGCGVDRSRSILVRRVISRNTMADWAQFESTSARDFFTKVLGFSVIVDYARRTQSLGNGARDESRTQGTHQSQQRERLLYAAIHAEDEAVEYLHKLDPAVALATACSVEQTLAIKWETKQEEMQQRGDPRKVMCITDRHWSELHFALARVPPGVHPDTAAEPDSCKY